MTTHCESCGRETADLLVTHREGGPVGLCVQCASGWTGCVWPALPDADATIATLRREYDARLATALVATIEIAQALEKAVPFGRRS